MRRTILRELPKLHLLPERFVESHGPLGTLWVGLGLGCFYLALIWLNTLLGFLLTPLFVIPQTWLLEAVRRRRSAKGHSNG